MINEIRLAQIENVEGIIKYMYKLLNVIGSKELFFPALQCMQEVLDNLNFILNK